MQLTTPRLVLRDFTAADWPAVLAYQRDPRYLRYYPWTERTEGDVRRLVQLFLDWQQEKPRRRFQLAITLPDTGRLIGNVGLRRPSDNDQVCEIGYELNPDYWGQGYATEAARAMVNYGFRELGLQRITSWCIADNSASARVLARLGLHQEEQRPQQQYFKGRYWDTQHYSLAVEEWG